MSLTVARFLSNFVTTTCKSLPLKGASRTQTLSRSFTSSKRPFLATTHRCTQHYVRSAHTKDAVGDKELVDFLNEEIEAEKKLQKPLPGASALGGFTVDPKGSQLTFSKKHNNETITVLLNVNHSVNTDEPDIDPKMDQPEVEMKSKPTFDVEISKGGKKFCFTCSYFTAESQPEDSEEMYDDVFSIDEVSIYSGEFGDSTYAAGGDILDSYLYDLFMNMLEERGLSNDFVSHLSDYSTAYEHKLYIGMLEDIRSFVSK